MNITNLKQMLLQTRRTNLLTKQTVCECDFIFNNNYFIITSDISVSFKRIIVDVDVLEKLAPTKCSNCNEKYELSWKTKGKGLSPTLCINCPICNITTDIPTSPPG